MKIILTLSVLFATAASDFIALKRTCIETFYLKTVLASSEDKQFCKNLFRNFTGEFTSSVMQRLTAKDDQECILRKFEEYKINDLHLRGLVSHLFNGTAQSEAYEDDVDESIDALLKAVKPLCAVGVDHNKVFEDGFKEAQQVSDPESLEFLCSQKYFIEKNLINPTDYNVDMTTYASLTCNDVYKNLDQSFKPVHDSNNGPNTFFGLSAVKAQECTAKKFDEDKVLEKILSFSLIVHFNMTASQKIALRERYKGWQQASVIYMLDCIKEI